MLKEFEIVAGVANACRCYFCHSEWKTPKKKNGERKRIDSFAKRLFGWLVGNISVSAPQNERYTQQYSTYMQKWHQKRIAKTILYIWHSFIYSSVWATKPPYNTYRSSHMDKYGMVDGAWFEIKKKYKKSA